MKLLIFYLCFVPFLLLAQTREELIEEYLNERNKMMEEIMKMFNEDMDSMMNDDFFDMDPDAFFNSRSLRGGSQDITVEQRYEKDGSIAIVISPKQNVQLNISTDNNMITIKSEVKVEEENSSEKKSSVVQRTSVSTKSISVPKGYKVEPPVYKGEKIIIKLLASENLKKLKKNKKVPVGPMPGDQAI